MLGIGGFELVIILVFAFLIFGPDKLPGVIKNVSHIWNQLKGLRQQADQVIKAEVMEPLKDIEATINPLAEEGMSATNALASKLGLKTDTSDTVSSVDTAAAADGATAADATSAANEAATTSAAAVSATAVATEPQTKNEDKEKPVAKAAPKQKTESFAEKKARLEREHREKQEAIEDSAETLAVPAGESSSTESKSDASNETAG